jgi:biotin carboxyl carrier protein
MSGMIVKASRRQLMAQTTVVTAVRPGWVEDGQWDEFQLFVHLAVGAGDRVWKNQPLFDLETVKVRFEVPSPVEGKVLGVYIDDGARVGPNAPIMKIAF